MPEIVSATRVITRVCPEVIPARANLTCVPGGIPLGRAEGEPWAALYLQNAIHADLVLTRMDG